jgi:hypothetical protein
VKIRAYSGPLTVLAAGVLGFSLICIVSAAALTNQGASEVPELKAQGIVDSAFSNPINTAVAMTAVEILKYIPTHTPTFTASVTSSPTEITYITPTRPFITWTPVPPTRTRMSRPSATNVPSQVPSRVPTKISTSTRKPPTPTNTPRPTFTNTPRPTFTNTPRPTFTNTPRYTPTDVPVPPTDTSLPPLDTPEPPTQTPEIPSDTPEPPTSVPDTDTPAPLEASTTTPVP